VEGLRLGAGCVVIRDICLLWRPRRRRSIACTRSLEYILHCFERAPIVASTHLPLDSSDRRLEEILCFVIARFLAFQHSAQSAHGVSIEPGMSTALGRV
jgi:hypothetical protein